MPGTIYWMRSHLEEQVADRRPDGNGPVRGRVRAATESTSHAVDKYAWYVA